ncbi:MAG: tyrosine-type recombinase/integrase [Flavobacteriales bacterium]|nr:tyrosine-type recombinase/integrase [Flavobacteriales bacterium]
MKNLPVKSPSFRYLEKSFREWLDVLGYAPTTVYMMPNTLREFFYYLEQNGITNITQMDTKDIRAYYTQLKTRPNTRRGGGLSNSYLNKQLQMLYKFTEYLRQSGRLVLPPLNLEWESDDTEEITFLTQGEIKELFNATYGYNEGTALEPLNSRDRAILCVFYGCGLRRNEGYHLDVSDINFERQIIHVRRGKAYKERLVPFNKTLSKHLQDYVYEARVQLVTDSREEAFFISQRGTRMDSMSMSLRLKLLKHRTDNIELQNKNVRLHVLRHSIATHFLQNGMSLEKIARFLGHASLESTQVYTHLAHAENGQEEPKQPPYRNIPKYEYFKLHEDEL